MACSTGQGICPLNGYHNTLEAARSAYAEHETRTFARQAMLQHNAAVMQLPEGGVVPRNPRIEEVVQFARRMGCRRLGIAFCSALRREARIVHEICTKRGFDVVSVCCMVGSEPVATAGLSDEEQLFGPEAHQIMCNPIGQAAVLNDQEVELNIAVGLCVGHDALFFKHAQAPTTVLVVKDRVMGNNPAAALWEADRFYQWLSRDDRT